MGLKPLKDHPRVAPAATPAHAGSATTSAAHSHRDPRQLTVSTPQACSEDVLAALLELILQGEEVDPKALPQRLDHAHKLAFVSAGGKAVATGAIKRPTPEHIKSIETHSQHSLPDGALELGYLYVEEQSRNQGIAADITAALLEGYKGPLFATTREDNAHMHGVLKKHGFNHVGQSWLSKLHPGRRLMLWLRNH